MEKSIKNEDKFKDKRFTHFGPSNFDPEGSYTGTPDDLEKPVQDADDLWKIKLSQVLHF